MIACGTCATYGGIHAMAGNPTGAVGLVDYLGKSFRSAAGLPVVNVPGCPVQPDNMMETVLYLLYQAADLSPIIPLDEQLTADMASVKPFMLMSVTEGEDKPLKYPTIFNTSDIAVITKADLAQAVEFDWDTAKRNIEAVRPGMEVITVSSKTGEGIDRWLQRLLTNAC